MAIGLPGKRTSAARPPARWREHAVLALALVSAAVLGAAALSVSSDPELAARTAFARMLAQVSGALDEEWQRMLHEPELPLAAAGPQSAQLPLLARPEPDSQAGAEPEARAAPLGELLLAESEQLELEQGDPVAALDRLDEALQAPLSPAQRGLVHLRGIALGLRAAQPERARAHWQAARAELAGGEAIEQSSALLMCLLAARGLAGPVAPADLGGAVALADEERVLALWERGELALPLAGLRVEAEPGERPWLAVRGLERVDALAAAFLGAEPAPERAQRLARWRDARVGEALARWRGPPRVAPLDAQWSIEAHDALALALRAAPAAPPAGATTSAVPLAEARVFASAELVAALEQRARARQLLPAGFALDASGARAELGAAVAERQALAGDALGFTLRHADPDALLRAESRRARLARLALFALAALVAAAGLATWRALRRERRLAALKSLFVANVSHELRTPVAAILLLSENLAHGRAGADGQAARYHELIRREAERLRGLVESVLDFSRLERGKPLESRREPVELASWWRATAAELAESARARGAEVAILGEPAGEAQLDVEALRRALQNLVHNALVHSGSQQLELEARVAEGELVLAVRDRGRGVPAAERERIFRPFERIEREHGAAGTGLGLAIVAAIAAAHGGRARVLDARPGARFELALPLASPEAAELARRAPGAEATKGAPA